MAERFDVIVVGAGPAGAFYALLTARAGLRVLVLDREPFPRNRICGGCLHPDCSTLWKSHGLYESFRRLPHQPIQTLALSNDRHHPIVAPFPQGGETHLAVDRSVLDHWLISEAQAAGAVFRDGVSVRSFEDRNLLITSEEEYSADLFVGADGRKSWMARASGLARRLGSCDRIAWHTRLPAHYAEPEQVKIQFFSEGYWGLNRHSEEQASLSLLLNRRTLDTPQMIVARYFDDLPPLGWFSTFPISRPRNLPARNKVLLIGDAARLLEPFTGEGIAMALFSARQAAKWTLACRDPARTYPGLEKAYSRAHARLYRNMSYHNAISRWLALDPHRGITSVNFFQRFPALLRFFVRDFHPGATAFQ